jgi:hypothetical protein
MEPAFHSPSCIIKRVIVNHRLINLSGLCHSEREVSCRSPERGNSDRNQFAVVAIRAIRADKGFLIVVAVVHGFLFLCYWLPRPF